MKDYHESEAELNTGRDSRASAASGAEVGVTANEEVTGSELVGQPGAAKKQGVTRRKFMRDAALGAAAAGAVLSMKGGVGSLGDALGQTTDKGTVTLDAVLLSYLACPAGSMPPASSIFPSQLKLTTTYASTLMVSATASESTSITASISVPGIIDVSSTFSQSNSSTVTGAVTITNTKSQTIQTLPGTVANTQFYGLLNPQAQFSGNSAGMVFKLVKADGIFVANQANFLGGQTGISPNTYNQILDQYPPLTEPNGSTLTAPRFKKKFFAEANSGGFSQTYQNATGTSFSEQLTSTITASITASVGFSTPFGTATFKVGNTIGFTTTSVQEVTSNKIEALTVNLFTPESTIFNFYRDKVYKTYAIINAGAPATSGQPVVQGTVTDSNGDPIAGAYVSLTVGVTVYQAVTNSSGNYSIATPAGSPIPTGTCTITSGNVTNNITVGGGTTTANLAGAIASEATDQTTTDETIYTLDD